MEEFAKVQCPFCGQAFDVEVDPTVSQQRFTTDCEVCCRPFEVFVECEGGKVMGVDVSSE